jgi:hypothetical protein
MKVKRVKVKSKNILETTIGVTKDFMIVKDSKNRFNLIDRNNKRMFKEGKLKDIKLIGILCELLNKADNKLVLTNILTSTLREALDEYSKVK